MRTTDWAIGALALLIAGTARAAPTYDAGGVPIAPTAESDRSALVAEVKRRLARGGGIETVTAEVAGLEVSVDARRLGRLARLPLAVLAVAAVVPCAHRRDAELDLLVRVDGEGEVPVTAWCAPGGALILRAGAPMPAMPGEGDPRTIAAELTERTGVGPFVNGEAAWSATELRGVARALDRLAPAERAVIAGLPWSRDRAPSSAVAGPHAAWFELQDGRGALHFLDAAFAEPGTFLGDPEAPLPASARVVLHEVGHAIARASLLRAQQGAVAAAGQAAASTEHATRLVGRAQAAIDAFNGDVARHQADRSSYEARVVEHNALVLRGRRGEVSAAQLQISADHLATWGARLQAEAAVLARRKDEVESLRAAAEAAGSEQREEVGRAARAAQAAEVAHEDAPLLRAFLAVAGPGEGPTRHVGVDPDERFAEAFALARLDPDALRRIDRSLLRWFDDGAHLAWLGANAP